MATKLKPTKYRVTDKEAPLHYPPAEKVHKVKGEWVVDPEAEYRDAQAGDVVDDLPECSIPWMLEQGIIEEV